MARQDDRLQAAEDVLVEAMQLLLRMPDRERAWLYHSTLRWPDMVKDVQADYADDAEPRRPLGRRDMDTLGAVFGIDGRADYLLAEIVPDNRKLVGVVLARKAGRMAGGFDWSDVWQALGGKRSGVTSEALRKRYERCLDRLAGRMGVAPAEAGARW